MEEQQSMESLNSLQRILLLLIYVQCVQIFLQNRKLLRLAAVTPQALVDWTGSYMMSTDCSLTIILYFAGIDTIIVGIYTTAVKNQCRCGCCWAFAAVEQIESDAIRTKNWSVNSPLSTAQACECTYSPSNLNGCDGGWPDDAYDYVKSVGGI